MEGEERSQERAEGTGRASAQLAGGSGSTGLRRDVSEQRMLLKAGDSPRDGTGGPWLRPAVMATRPLPDPAKGWADAPPAAAPLL